MYIKRSISLGIIVIKWSFIFTHFLIYPLLFAMLVIIFLSCFLFLHAPKADFLTSWLGTMSFETDITTPLTTADYAGDRRSMTGDSSKEEAPQKLGTVLGLVWKRERMPSCVLTVTSFFSHAIWSIYGYISLVGVFVPCILSIFGAILFLRLPWGVGLCSFSFFDFSGCFCPLFSFILFVRLLCVYLRIALIYL